MKGLNRIFIIFLIFQFCQLIFTGCAPKLTPLSEQCECKYLISIGGLELDSNKKFINPDRVQLGLIESQVFITKCEKRGGLLFLKGLTSIGGLTIRMKGTAGMFILSCTKDSFNKFSVKDTLAISGIDGKFSAKVRIYPNLFLVIYDKKGGFGYYEALKVL